MSSSECVVPFAAGQSEATAVAVEGRKTVAEAFLVVVEAAKGGVESEEVESLDIDIISF